jgi:signal transduction histidine kinase
MIWQKFLNYFQKREDLEQESSSGISEPYFIYFSYLCIQLLLVFIILNMAVNFWQAALIDVVGIGLYFIGLFINRNSSHVTLPMSLLILNCIFILFMQQIIIDWNAYHNMFFYPAIATFTFGLLENRRVAFILLGVISLAAAVSHFVAKYAGTTIKNLTPVEKDIYIVVCVFSSLYATYQAAKVLYQQRQRAYEQLNIANQQLTEANDQNRQLLGLLTHDIANPLSVMTTGYYIWERSDRSDEKFEKFSQRFKKSEKILIDIVEKARKMLALEAGKLEVAVEEVDLKKVIENVKFVFQEKLKNKNIQLNIQMPAEDILVSADETGLSNSVVGNLVSNAIKFSPQDGCIDLVVTKLSSQAQIIVKDYGMGMPVELMQKIFSANSATTREGTGGERGTGFGMPLTKAYVEKFGGMIMVKSEEGKGTEFTVRIPLYSKSETSS